LFLSLRLQQCHHYIRRWICVWRIAQKRANFWKNRLNWTFSNGFQSWLRIQVLLNLISFSDFLPRLRVFENRVLRRILGTKREEVAWGWRKLHNEELHKLYGSPIIIRVIKLRRIRLAGHVVCMGEWEMYTTFWWKT